MSITEVGLQREITILQTWTSLSLFVFDALFQKARAVAFLLICYYLCQEKHFNTKLLVVGVALNLYHLMRQADHNSVESLGT